MRPDVQSTTEAVEIAVRGGGRVRGDLAVPEGAMGVVVFAHGSGSSRHSSRNQLVAAGLRDRGVATLLMDLLTLDEEAIDARTRHLRFDIPLLAARLEAAVDWLLHNRSTRALRRGYFGASTGAAAALIAAARAPDHVDAVVSRGGRPDLAGEHLRAVRAPTLLVVGGDDDAVVELNQNAYEELGCERRMHVVPGATHLFPEPGALEEVTRVAADWFAQHLTDEKGTHR